LDGFAAVFDSPTVIDSWEGRFREEIAPGAMKKSFRERPPVIQFDHGKHPMVGSIPIASVDVIEEASDPDLAPRGGAHVVATLHDNWLVEPVREAIRSGAISGMSFRFGVVSEEWFDAAGKKLTTNEQIVTELDRAWLDNVPDDQLPLRRLRELKVPELGPVVFPAYADTSVGVRSITIDLDNLSDKRQRAMLARAVILTDQSDAEPQESVVPQPTLVAGEHTDRQIDTPQPTEPSAGEHVTAVHKRVRARLAQAHDVMWSIDSKGTTTP
jgi:phage head maturation protease